MRNRSLSAFSPNTLSWVERSSPLGKDCLVIGLLALIGCGTAAVARADDATPEREALTIEVANVQSSDGTLMVQIMAGEAGFKGETPATAQFVLPPAEPTIRFSLDSLPPGEYAIRVMHDVDGNGELKTNLVGMPTEPRGMSNDAKGRFGPPKWTDAKFSYPEVTTQRITLN